MNKVVKWILITFGSVVGILGVLVIVFIVEMTPSESKEVETKEQARIYLDAHYSGEMEIYDTLYDNMGNFGFDYAAKVRNTRDGVEFLVYEETGTGEMVDTYKVNYYEKKLYDRIVDDIENRFSDAEMIITSYTTKMDKVEATTGELPDLTELDVAPKISIWLQRSRKGGDEEKVTELIDILKDEVKLPHASIKVEYESNEKKKSQVLVRDY